MTSQEFKEIYTKHAKSWKDAEMLIDKLDSFQRKELFDALNFVADFMGLDMRQDFYRGILKFKTKEKICK